MASKAYLPRKCVSRNEESHHRSEVQKRTPCSLTSNKSRTFQSLRSVTNVKKCSTANADSNVNKRQNSCNPQPSSDSTEETDFAGFTNLEDEAFQLASYIESDATFDEIMSEAREKNRPNSTLKDAFDLRDASLDELLDATIEELQNAVDGRNANTSISVTFRDSISNQMKMSPNSQTTVIDGTSERRNENIDAGKVGGSRTGSFHNVHSRKSNSSIGYPRILSNERANFGDQTRSRPTPNSSATHQTVLTRRATVSSSASTPSHSKAAFGRMPYTTWTKNVALKQKLIHLFNRPCHNYLTGKCSGGMCKWNHSLPPARDISQKLMLLNDETVKYMYFNFVLRTSKAFVTYFPTMCEVLGKRKMKPILMEAVSKCEERDNVSFFKFIFDGLLLLGSSKMEALTTVIDRCSKNSKCYGVLLEIMIETDALYFVDTLKQCYLHGTIRGELMQKLLQQVVETPGTELLPVFIDILDNYSMCQTFDKEAFGRIIPRTMKLVRGNLSLTEKLSRIVNRMK